MKKPEFVQVRIYKQDLPDLRRIGSEFPLPIRFVTAEAVHELILFKKRKS